MSSVTGKCLSEHKHRRVWSCEQIVSFTVQTGSNPLHVASHEGYTEIVDALLKNGADPNQTTMVQGEFYIFLACVLFPNTVVHNYSYTHINTLLHSNPCSLSCRMLVALSH